MVQTSLACGSIASVKALRAQTVLAEGALTSSKSPTESSDGAVPGIWPSVSVSTGKAQSSSKYSNRVLPLTSGRLGTLPEPHFRQCLLKTLLTAPHSGAEQIQTIRPHTLHELHDSLADGTTKPEQSMNGHGSCFVTCLLTSTPSCSARSIPDKRALEPRHTYRQRADACRSNPSSVVGAS